MELSDGYTVVGILISLSVFCWLVVRAVVAERQAPAALGNCKLRNNAVERNPRPGVSRVLRACFDRGYGRAQPKAERIVSSNSGKSGVGILAISKDLGFRDRLKSLAAFYSWDLVLCVDCEGASGLLTGETVPIVICDRDTLGIDWRDAFKMILSTDPSRCVVLCSKADNNDLWQDVIRSGGYDVVRKPLHEEQIVRTVQFAWTFWKTVRSASSMKNTGRPATVANGQAI